MFYPEATKECDLGIYVPLVIASIIPNGLFYAATVHLFREYVSHFLGRLLHTQVDVLKHGVE
jgi:hypothetical protein